MTASAPDVSSSLLDPEEARELRVALIDRLIAEGSLRDARVVAAFSAVPRHLFVPDVGLGAAYSNRPLPIGHGQTISQPTVVAMMTEALRIERGQKVLEIGTGSGWQAAILAAVGANVFSIETVTELAEQARERLRRLGFRVQVKAGDGYLGWPEHAPFDRILLTAAPPEVPQALIDQLRDGGILIAPIGEPWSWQRLMRIRREGLTLVREELDVVAFVPMVHA